MLKQAKKMKVCSPETCDHCMYIGEGDFICFKGIDEVNKLEGVVVMEDWEPTDMYLHCQLVCTVRIRGEKNESESADS